VVVDDVQNLEALAALQLHVGDIGLPALIGQIGHEAHIGALGPLLGLGDDEAPGLEHPPDGRGRRNQAMSLPQVVEHRLGPGIEPVVEQLLAQGHDLVLPVIADPRRRAPGAAASRHPTARWRQAAVLMRCPHATCSS
jgi:hypothetical protein